MRYLLVFALIILAFAGPFTWLACKDHYGWATVVSVIGLGVLIFSIPFSIYQSSHNMYTASNVVEKTDAENLAYDERAPYDVAANTSGRNLGTTNGDNLDKITYIPALKSWTTTVNKRGIGVGYDKIQEMKLPLIGQAESSEVSFCSFSPSAKRSLSGTLWTSSLSVQIAQPSFCAMDTCSPKGRKETGEEPAKSLISLTALPPSASTDHTGQSIHDTNGNP